MAEPGRAGEEPQGQRANTRGLRCAAPVHPLTRGRRSRRSRAAGSADREVGGVVERHLRLVALEGDTFPAPRRPADEVPSGRAGGKADWLGDRFDGEPQERGADGGRSGRAGRGPRADIKVTDVRPASRIADRTTGASAPWDDTSEGAVEPQGRTTRPGRGAGASGVAGRGAGKSGVAGRGAGKSDAGGRGAGESGVAGRGAGKSGAGGRRAGEGDPTERGQGGRAAGRRATERRAVTAESGWRFGGPEGHEFEEDPEWRPVRRPVRLTRRGRLVVLALVLVIGALVGFLSAAPGQAADPARPVVTAVVQPGDTLWSFSERNLPNWQPQAGVVELKRLNDLEGYVIHPGQRLALPARR